MRLNVLRNALFTAGLSAIIGVTIYAQGQAPQGQARAPQNLQVLPKDMTLQQVQQTMRGFTAALGVECSHCHVGTMQERSKDDNPKKAVARKMLVMVADINKEMLKDIGEPSPTAKVTCFTCHRGQITPLTAPGGGH